MKLNEARRIPAGKYDNKNPKHVQYQAIIELHDRVRSLQVSLAVISTELEKLFQYHQGADRLIEELNATGKED